MDCFALLASDEAEQHIRCHLSYFNQRLVNSCQWWRHLGGIHNVVETDHAHLIGDANIALVEYLVDACCLCIVASEDRRRRIWLIEQETGLLDAVAQQVGAFADQRRINWYTRAFERLAVSCQTRAGSGEMEREGDNADSPMAQGDQILSRCVSSQPDG